MYKTSNRHNKTFIIKRKSPKISFYNFLAIPYYVLASCLIALPMILIILYAFNDGSGTIFQIRFSAINFTDFFTNRDLMRTLGESLYIAMIGTFATLLVGYPLAYFITKAKTKNRVLFLSLTTAPIWLNAFLRINGLRQVFMMINENILGTDFALITGIVFMFLPFMVLPIYTVLMKIDPNLYESSADLGANSAKTFFKVVMPLTLSGVISGIMMVFLSATTSIVIPIRLGGGQRRLIGVIIENAVNVGRDTGFGAAMAIIVGLILLLFIYLIRKTDKYGVQLTDEKNL